jgi:hypothetical protein
VLCAEQTQQYTTHGLDSASKTSTLYSSVHVAPYHSIKSGTSVHFIQECVSVTFSCVQLSLFLTLYMQLRQTNNYAQCLQLHACINVTPTCFGVQRIVVRGHQSLELPFWIQSYSVAAEVCAVQKHAQYRSDSENARGPLFTHSLSSEKLWHVAPEVRN